MRCVRHGRACGEPPTVLQCPSTGCRYLVRRLLGKGGFARVYRVAELLAQEDQQHESPQVNPPSSPSSPSSFSPLLPPPPPFNPALNPASKVSPPPPPDPTFDPSTSRGEHGSLATPFPPPSPLKTPAYNHYALKVISKCRLADSSVGNDALRNEVTIHQKLQHPAIVSLITYWEDQFRIYILMNLIDGPTLEEHVATRGRLTEPEASLYTAQILEALSYLHANRIVHKDIKLANLLLSSDLRRVHLCDFGLSAHVDSLSHVHKSPVCGTPNYVAPELLVSSSSSSSAPKSRLTRRPQPHNPPKSPLKHVSYTSSADIWSTGVVLFMMVVGCGPFDSDDVSRTFRRIRTARFTFPIGVKVSVTVKSLIRALLAEDPSKRPNADHALRHAFFANNPMPRHIRHEPTPAPEESRRLRYERERRGLPDGTVVGRRVASGNVDAPPVAQPPATTRTSARNASGTRAMSFDRKGRWLGNADPSRRAADGSMGISPSAWTERRRTSGMSAQTGEDNLLRNTERRVGRPTYDRASSARKSGRSATPVTRVAQAKDSFAPTKGTNRRSRRQFPLVAMDCRKEIMKLSVSLSAALVKGHQLLGEGRHGAYQKVIRDVDGMKDAPPLVRRWLDYTSKYGFATLMEDGRIGCCFNDGSIMFFISDGGDVPDVAYIGPTGRETAVPSKADKDADCNGGNGEDLDDKGRRHGCDVSKKACLCTLFADMMTDGGRDCMYDLPWACNVSFLKGDEADDDEDEMAHVREWARLKHVKAAGFRLSNHSIHVKFDVDDELCDDYVFNMVDGTLFYRQGKQTRTAHVCNLNDLGEFSAISEDVHAQLVICGQMVSRFLE